LSTIPAIREAAPPAESRGLVSAVRRLLREPLVHFLVLGAALFVVSSAVERRRGATPASRQIVLTVDDLQQLQFGFAAQWRRPPTREEMIGLIENRIREEILYREALAMGLDKDDTIVKRRMAQKMQFLSEDTAAREPKPGELAAWFAANGSMFEQPPRVTFRLLYFSPDKRGPDARRDAETALAKLTGKPEDWPGAAALGDPFMFPDYLADRAPDQIAKDFGPVFAKALFEQKPGAWSGPLESGYGSHLVFVDSLIPGRSSSFEEVEPDVKTAWLAAQKAEAWDKAFREMRSRYELVLPAPPPQAGGTGAAKSPEPAR
jgi:hypothetical protein